MDWSVEDLHSASEARPRVLTRAQLARRIRSHVGAEFYDETTASGAGTAIYTLSDPRDLLLVRYVGQSGAPQRRFLQHLNCARLWLPDELPWWVKSPRLRPLYRWIRELHRESARLPTMIVRERLEGASQVRGAERALICACLAQRLPLLNYEAEIMERQLRLL